MKNSFIRLLLFYIVLFFTLKIQAQTQEKFQQNVAQLLASPEGKTANISIYIENENGDSVFEYQAEKGLTTASTQKIFTAATAYELLSPEFRFTTKVEAHGEIVHNELHGALVIRASGDPSLGSWRWTETKPEAVFKKILNALQQNNIQKIRGEIKIDESISSTNPVPDGWLWEDIGNYYGAGTFALNWRENQFDIQMNNGKIVKTTPKIPEVEFINEIEFCKADEENVTLYSAPFSQSVLLEGCMPNIQKNYSGAMTKPSLFFLFELKNYLRQHGIQILDNVKDNTLISTHRKTIVEIQSPKLTELNTFFLKKSINLYGEVLIKSLARHVGKKANFKNGILVLKNFWKEKGIPSYQINFVDGSGLSPKNYVSAKAHVKALQYTKKQKWFADYLAGFNIQSNGMQLKSGTMRHTKSFAGYYTKKDGKQFVISIIANNLQGKNNTQTLLNLLAPLLDD